MLTRCVGVFLLRLFFQLLLGCLVSAEEDAGAAEGVEEEEELVLVDVESFSGECHRLLQLLVRAACLRLFTQALLQVATNTSINF